MSGEGQTIPASVMPAAGRRRTASRLTPPSQSRDRGCRIGEIHALNGGIERCPRCLGQDASGDCNGTEEQSDQNEDPDH